MEYTHKHANINKIKTVQKKKVQEIDPVRKGNQNLCKPVKNKTD